MARKSKSETTDTFRERLNEIGDNDIAIGDFKVDDLRKIASKLGISGSHDMNKEQLVDTINKVRRTGEHANSL